MKIIKVKSTEIVEYKLDKVNQMTFQLYMTIQKKYFLISQTLVYHKIVIMKLSIKTKKI